jgi:threonine aldolase
LRRANKLRRNKSEEAKENGVIELRSDTFTLPTADMLAAILTAELGQDGYGEDPTVNKLEALAASRLGKEAACLMPSGTMANLATILAHCDGSRGRILVGDQSDIYACEDRTVGTCCGVVYCSVPTQADGTLLLSRIEAEFDRPPAESRIELVCIENPHNLCGGVVLSNEYVRELAALAHARGARLHMDGARIFNAAVASGVAAAEIAGPADTVQFCLSKGLSAPAGSIVVGRLSFIEKIRRQRKMLGGNMCQAGIIAAAGIVALEQMVDRLLEDHALARRLAQGIDNIEGIELAVDTVQTNTVVFRVIDRRFDVPDFIAAARRHGLHLSDFEYGRIRAVVHHGITAGDIDAALNIMASILNDECKREISEGCATASMRRE